MSTVPEETILELAPHFFHVLKSPINTWIHFNPSNQEHHFIKIYNNKKILVISPLRFQTISLIPSFFGNRTSQNNVFDPFSTDIWDPFVPFTSSTLSVPSGSELVDETARFANTKIDWKETPEAHVFKADLPGLKKEEVKIELEEGRVLQISGERSKEKEEKNDKWHRVERSAGKFLRRFRLPENSKPDQIKASIENGVLTVTIPKEEIKKSAVKAIDISG